MHQRRYFGIRFRIITCTVLCVVAVGLASNLYLYQYMRKIITAKVSQIDALNSGTIAAQLDASLERAVNLESYCSYSTTVISALSGGNASAALAAQGAMNTYLRTSPIDSYVNRLMLFNEDGVCINAITVYDGTLRDYENIWTSEQFLCWRAGDYSPFTRLFPSLNPYGADCFALFDQVYSYNSNQRVGYVYIELDPAIITDILEPYNDLNLFFVRSDAGDRLTTWNSAVPADRLPGPEQGNTFGQDGILYSIQEHPLRTGSLVLVNCINETRLQADDHNILFSVAMVSCMIVLIAAFVMALLTHYITTPIRRITEKINRIALNDYSFDPELEKPRSEMGEIGARLNELGLGFQQLLSETIALHDERSRIEMDLLQSQVNPHFLYNTLNSVHWMAVVQKNTGIENMVKSLVSLLKNISKGVSDKITLGEELALLEDYVNIQSIRYMGAFEYVCRVPEELRRYRVLKFTLQPLVENAIFHGVVPKGEFGTITVDAFEEENFLVLTIEDDGVGMTGEEAAALLQPREGPDKSSMTGIGVGNVHRRLRLCYGKGAGLRVESVPGERTKVYVRVGREL